MKILVFKINGDNGPNFFICFVFEDERRENDAVWCGTLQEIAIACTDVTNFNEKLIMDSIEFHNMTHNEIENVRLNIHRMCPNRKAENWDLE